MSDQFSAFDETSGGVGSASVQAPGPKGYEFSPSENQLLRDLSHKLSGVGCFAFLVGLFYGCLGLFGVFLIVVSSSPSTSSYAGLTQVIGAFLAVIFGVATLVFLASGLYMRRGAGGFRQAADTAGNDIRHVVKACADLTGLYRLWSILLALALLATLSNFWQVARLFR